MTDASDHDLLAAEYVLGTLEGEEAAQAAELRASDAAFAAAVLRWEGRLTPLATCAPSVAPPPDLWERIETATAPAVSAPASPASGTASPASGPASPGSNTAAPAVGSAGVVPFAWHRRLRVWQASTGVAVAIAASLAAFIVQRAAPRVAVLAPTAGGVPVLLATMGSDGALSVRQDGTIAVPSDHDLELWALDAGEIRPHSLGVLPATGRRLVAAVPPGTQLLVSLEPRGGSPTGQPSGPVLYGGRLTALE